MIDAVMYGMMPSAKTDRRRILPPANRSKKPKIEPVWRVRKSCQRMTSMPGVGTKAAEPVNGQHGEREQHPLPEIRNAEDIADRFKELSHGFLALSLRLLFYGSVCSSKPLPPR